MKPYLREHSPIGLDEIPQAPTYEAGYLVSKNAGWRSVRPVIDTQRCIACLQCYLYCPDGVIFKDKENGKVAVDYDFCKGCGVCASVCHPDVIHMEAEK